MAGESSIHSRLCTSCIEFCFVWFVILFCHSEGECFFATAVSPTDVFKRDLLSSCLTLDVVLLNPVERVHKFQSCVVFHCNPVNALRMNAFPFLSPENAVLFIEVTTNLSYSSSQCMSSVLRDSLAI